MIDRPERANAIADEDWPVLTTFCEQLVERAGDDQQVLVITGRGRTFSSGADLAGLRALDSESSLTRMRRVNRAVGAWAELPFPTIAAVNGPAVGVSAGLALLSDLVLVVEDARFAFPFAVHGLAPDGGCSWLLPRLLGVRRAMALLGTSGALTAAEAASAGAVTEVLPSAQRLEERVATIAQQLLQQPVRSYSLTKHLIWQGSQLGLAEALEQEAMAQALNLDAQPAGTYSQR